MRALITGATGYTGVRLAARLRAAGHDVHVVLRAGSDDSRLAAQSPPPVRHRLTVGGWPDAELLAAIRPDAIFHLAFAGAAGTSADFEESVRFSLRLFEAATGLGGMRIINVGTWWQFGEHSEISPNCLYAAAKQAVHDLMTGYATRGLSACTVVPFDIYGPGDWRGKILHVLRSALDKPVATTAGMQLMDLVHVDDVIDGMIAAALTREPAGTAGFYTLGTGRLHSLREVAAIFTEIAGRTPKLAWGERPYPANQVFRPCAADRPPPGWSPRIGLEDGFREVLTIG